MLSILGWMTSFARVYHPRRLLRLLPHRPRRLMALQCQRRQMWSRPRPHQGMDEWTRGTPRICLAPMPRTDAWVIITLVTRTAPICLENKTSGIWEVRHLSDGAHSWTLVNRLIQMARSSARTPPVRIIAAQPDLLRIHIMGPATPGMNQRVRIRGDTPLTSPRIPTGPRRWMWTTNRMMKPIFPKGDRSCHPAIGIGANLPTPLGIAHWMPRLLRVGNIMVINGGTILSLRRSS